MIRPMTEDDLGKIDRLERILFASPWPMSAYKYELEGNPYAHVCVLEEEGKIVGYFDYWIIFERAEIATIGVVPEYRRQGYAQKMMDHIVENADREGCENITLEVRVSNTAAIRLYEKNGFIQANIRKNYYDDNGEDAYLMIRPLGGYYNDNTDGD